MSRTKLSATKLALAGRALWEQDGALRVAEPIAIIGIGMRFPGGITDPDSLWQALLEGRDLITEVPPDRWDNTELYHPDPATPGRVSTKWGGFLDDIRVFDAAYFDITGREAERMDPQQRIALEVTCEAIERAGIPLSSLRGSATGVYFSSYHNDYTQLQYADRPTVSGRTLTGSLHSIIPNRISYSLGLRGPSMTIDSACSSSLLSCHLACQALRNRECELAVAGGVNVSITPDVTIALSKGGFMSPTGHCWTFDANADGFVRSEGCAVVVLKRLSDAIAAGDPVLAVIRGSAVNQDGQSTTLSAPNGLAQADMLRTALRNAGMEPDDISLIEAHGTGTELGDPIETDALASVFGPRDPARGPCWLGSLKSNFGHMEAAAGLAGLIKVVLVLRHGVVPPHALFTRLNPHINFDGTPLEIARRPTPLDSPAPRRAGVSSFGVGGTNAHVIIEEAPAALARQREPIAPPHLLVLSARSARSLRGLAARYVRLLRAGTDPGAVARAAARRRAHYAEYRIAITGASAEALAQELEKVAAGGTAPPVLTAEPPVCFVFSGQGTQWPGMALALREQEPVFRAALDEVDSAFGAIDGIRPLAELSRTAAESRLDRTDVAQTTMFAVQVALLRLLAHRGLRPTVVIGHSVGELAAAYAAGMLTLEQAVQAVVDRGAAMQGAFDSGRMVAVRLTEAAASEFLHSHNLELTIAAVNGPAAVVLSGRTPVVDAACALLSAAGVRHSLLDVRFAFHSPLMMEAVRQLRARSQVIRGEPTGVTFISTVTGAPQNTFDYEYLATNVGSAVRFRDAVAHALSLGIHHFVEIGPHPALGNAVVETAEAAGAHAEAAYCQHRDKDAAGALLQLMARTYSWGCNLDWSAVLPGECAPVDLPTYAWAHEPYWLPAPRATAGARNAAITGPAGYPGRRITSPALTRPVFELDAQDPVFESFADHAIGGTVRVPATGIVELFRSAAIGAGMMSPLVRDVGVMRAIEPKALRRLQVLLAEGVIGRAEICVETPDGDWAVDATAEITPAVQDASARVAEMLRHVDEAADLTPVSADDFYDTLAEAGITFGPAYRLLRGIRAGANCANGEIAIERGPAWDGAINPAILDAAAHLCIAVLNHDPAHAGRALLPWAVDGYHVFDANAVPSKACAVLTGNDSLSASFDVVLLDATNSPVAWLEGWRLRRMAFNTAVLRVSAWTPAEPVSRSEVSGSWLVLGDGGSTGIALCAALTAAGQHVTHVSAPQADLDALLAQDAWLGVVHLGTLDRIAADASADALLNAALQSVDPVLALARDAATRSRALRVVVVTRGIQSPGARSGDSAPLHATTLGVLRALRAEAPELDCTAIDLDPAAEPGNAEEIERLVDEILSTAHHDEVAVRESASLVHRTELTELQTQDARAGSARVLVHERPGTLDGFVLSGQVRERVPAGQVRVRVLAAGLNFRDVLTALGSYPGPADMGHECCGVVVETGAGVETFRVGDRVLAFWPGCFSNFVTVPVGFVFRAPAMLSPVECATLPIAYGTAWHALVNIGQLRAGQSVLIHAGAGGVGQAAVRLALTRGVRVYATAGTPEKRAYLESCGVAGAFDSRSASFSTAILNATNGEGVDLVLNSLIGDLIPAGMACVKSGGVFVELGKRDILSRADVEAIRPDIRYETFDLRDIALRDAAILPQMFSQLIPAIESGVLEPLPSVSLPLEHAQAGFRRMARAQHTGKIVFVPPPCDEPSESGWTVVTGGSGAMGMATLRWLLERGERRIALWSRRTATPETAADLDALCIEYNADIQSVAVDVANEAEVNAALEALRSKGPITGIVHAAGVLDDGTAAQITPDRLLAVIRPKLAGAWNLHRATLRDPIRAFVLYSAVGPLIDAAGQGSYAAANAFLDAFAVYRRGHGLPAVSMRWGMFRDGGMAARMTEAQQQRWVRKGLGWLDRDSGGAVFGAALTVDAPEVFAIELDRAERAPRERSATPSGSGAELVDRLRALPSHQRAAAAIDYVVTSVTSLLSLTGRADADVPLRDVGLDSLSAIELRNTLTVAAGFSLPATLAFDHPTAAAIASYLVARLGLNEPDAEREAAPAFVQPVDDEIATLTDEEAEALLLLELGATQDNPTEVR